MILPDYIITTTLQAYGEAFNPDFQFRVFRAEDRDAMIVSAVSYWSATNDHGHAHYTEIEGPAFILMDPETLMEYGALKVDSVALGLTLWELKCKDAGCGWHGYN